jgi:hypothetical protein
MVHWKEPEGIVDELMVADLNAPVGRAGTNDSVAIVSAAVAVFRLIRAIIVV